MIMLCYNRCVILILIALFHPSFTQRRIKDGREVASNKSYMVYLLEAPTAPNQYRGWLCGGAIISPDFILTAAACVQDVKHMYAIAGYDKYLPASELEGSDACLQKKKKVIQTCVPRDYTLDYNATEIWAKLDIAVVRVESPYNFDDATYWTGCSYTPNKISYNIEPDFPATGADVVALGWGHEKEFRKETDLRDLNQKKLQYAPTRIVDENICAEVYANNSAMQEIIRKEMLCTMGTGKLNDVGELLNQNVPVVRGCTNTDGTLRTCDNYPMLGDEIIDDPAYGPGEKARRIGNNTKHSTPNANDTVKGPYGDTSDLMKMYDINFRRRNNNTKQYNKKAHYGNETRLYSNMTSIYGNHTRKQYDANENLKNPNDYYIEYDNYNYDQDGYRAYGRQDDENPASDPLSLLPTDTTGICQNDHGGPLIAWRGPHEIVVAVSTVFRLSKQYKCEGPYLYTKTWCQRLFLECVINQTLGHGLTTPADNTRRSCDDPKDVGFEIVRRHISWIGHRDGPAENERIETRHQVPISHFRP